MKILIHQPRVSYYVGGGEVVPLEEARYFSKIGHEVTILTSKAPFIKNSDYYLNFIKNNPDIRIIELNVPKNLEYIYKTLPGTNWKRWDLESLNFSKIAFTEIEYSNYDIVAYHNIIDSINAPLNTPSILHLHGYPEELNYVYELILSKERPSVAVSHLVASKWKEMTGFNNIDVLHNGIDITRFSPNKNIEKKYDLLYIGRIIEIKGIQYIIDAIKILKDYKNITPKLAIACKGDYSDIFKETVKSLGLEYQIYFLGYVNDDDLVDLYNSTLVTVLPSYAREGVLTTMLESSACGVPTITTKETSMTEFLEDGVNGLAANARDAEDIARNIFKILNDNDLRISLANKTLDKVNNMWSWDKKIKELEAIYSKVINGKR